MEREYHLSPEEEAKKRADLIRGYEGQVRYCHKRIEREKRKLARKKNAPRYPKIRAAIVHYDNLAKAWEKRIELCRNGEPFENFLKKKVM